MAEGTVSVSVPVIYTNKKPTTPGLITMTKSKFIFAPDDSHSRSALKLDVDMGLVLGKFGSGKGKKEKVWLEITIHGSRDEKTHQFKLGNPEDVGVCRNHFALYGAKKKTEHGAKGAPDQEEKKKFGKEIERRITLIKRHEELRKLHEQLAGRNVLTDDEFWERRKNLLLGVAYDAPIQRTGLQNAMSPYLQQPIPDQFCGQKGSLEIMEAIQQIFAEKPVVLREFLNKVPQKMNLDEFWSKFLMAQSFRQKDKVKAGRAEACVDDQLAIFLKDDDIAVDEVLQKVRKVDPTINIFTDQADDYTHLPGHGNTVENADIDKSEQALLYDLNRHGDVVLEGRVIDLKLDDELKKAARENRNKDPKLYVATKIATALEKHKKAAQVTKLIDERLDERRMEKVNKMVVYDDLEMVPSLPYTSFHVKDARCFFDSHGDYANDELGESTHTKPNINIDEVRANLKEEYLKIKNQGFNNPILKSDNAVKVLPSIVQRSSLKKGHLDDNLENNVLDALPQETKNKFLEHIMVLQDLLWHFWNSYTLKTKIHNAKEMKEACQDRINLVLLIQQILKVLDVAFEHYDLEIKSRGENMDKS